MSNLSGWIQKDHCRMCKLIAAILVCLTSTAAKASRAEIRIDNDTISRHAQLRDVTVEGSNAQRQKDGSLWLFPTEYQRRHASDGFGVLKNLMIPGLDVDSRTGNVSLMELQATVYLDGQPCDVNDIAMMRPKDIVRIEYHDAPMGKFAKDNIAINFITKQYRYGGYAVANATQTIGYNSGSYAAVATLNKDKTTCSIFGGAEYSCVGSGEQDFTEYFMLPNADVKRGGDADLSRRSHNEYVQVRIQNRGEKDYHVGKIALYNNSKPKESIMGLVIENGVPEMFNSSTYSKSLTPKIDFNGELGLGKGQLLNYGLHGTYSRNNYSRNYGEGGAFLSATTATEDAFSFSAAAIYNKVINKNTLTAEVFHYHYIWNSTYGGDNHLWQHLWKGESLAFVSYNRPLNSSLSLQLRAGVDVLRYHLHGSPKFFQITPRAVANIRYRLPKGMLLWQAYYANPTYGMDIINNVEVKNSPYMVTSGTTNLRKSSDFGSHFYMNSQLGKLNVSAIAQYICNHNALMAIYKISGNGGQIAKTYDNNFDKHSVWASLSVSWPLMKKLKISGGLRYKHSSIFGHKRCRNDFLTGNASLVYFANDFSFAAYINMKQKDFKENTIELETVPIDYGLQMSYSKQNFFVMLDITSPFVKRRVDSKINTQVYAANFCTFDRTTSQYASITVQYNIDFGHKTERIEEEIDKSNNSSILKI